MMNILPQLPTTGEAHTLMNLMITTGLLHWPIWTLVVVWFATLHITVVAVSLYLHRDQTHRAVTLHPLVRHFFRFWIWFTTATSTREWVAVHRRHHTQVDVEGDPHSPRVFGLKAVLFEGVNLYRNAASDPDTLRTFGHGTPTDWVERVVYDGRWNLAGILTLMVLETVLFGPLGLTLWAFQMMGIPVLAAGIVNGLGHSMGYRNFDTPDVSRNILPWGILCGGEELHNNHHAFPGSARFSQKRGEFDIGWMYLFVLEHLGLARVERVAARGPVPNPGQTLVGHKVHLMSIYLREVMRPTWRMVRRNGFRPTRRDRHLFWLAPKLLDGSESDRADLDQLLASEPMLRTVYEFRKELHRIWENGAQAADRLEGLREWLRQARASGVNQLEHFSEKLHALIDNPAWVAGSLPANL